MILHMINSSWASSTSITIKTFFFQQVPPYCSSLMGHLDHWLAGSIKTCPFILTMEQIALINNFIWKRQIFLAIFSCFYHFPPLLIDWFRHFHLVFKVSSCPLNSLVIWYRCGNQSMSNERLDTDGDNLLSDHNEESMFAIFIIVHGPLLRGAIAL